MEPRDVTALVDGYRLRASDWSELVSWGVWMICCCMPFSGLPAEARGSRIAFLKMFTPPFFIPPNKR
jgi:hypothetical protein